MYVYFHAFYDIDFLKTKFVWYFSCFSSKDLHHSSHLRSKFLSWFGSFHSLSHDCLPSLEELFQVKADAEVICLYKYKSPSLPLASSICPESSCHLGFVGRLQRSAINWLLLSEEEYLIVKTKGFCSLQRTTDAKWSCPFPYHTIYQLKMCLSLLIGEWLRWETLRFRITPERIMTSIIRHFVGYVLFLSLFSVPLWS